MEEDSRSLVTTEEGRWKEGERGKARQLYGDRWKLGFWG